METSDGNLEKFVPVIMIQVFLPLELESPKIGRLDCSFKNKLWRRLYKVISTKVNNNLNMNNQQIIAFDQGHYVGMEPTVELAIGSYLPLQLPSTFSQVDNLLNY